MGAWGHGAWAGRVQGGRRPAQPLAHARTWRLLHHAPDPLVEEHVGLHTPHVGPPHRLDTLVAGTVPLRALHEVADVVAAPHGVPCVLHHSTQGVLRVGEGETPASLEGSGAVKHVSRRAMAGRGTMCGARHACIGLLGSAGQLLVARGNGFLLLELHVVAALAGKGPSGVEAEALEVEHEHFRRLRHEQTPRKRPAPVTVVAVRASRVDRVPLLLYNDNKCIKWIGLDWIGADCVRVLGTQPVHLLCGLSSDKIGRWRLAHHLRVLQGSLDGSDVVDLERQVVEGVGAHPHAHLPALAAVHHSADCAPEDALYRGAPAKSAQHACQVGGK